MKNLKLGIKLYGGFLLVVLVFGAMSIYQINRMGKLGELQDEVAGRSRDAEALGAIDSRLEAVYPVIADAIINRDLDSSRRDFAEVRKAANEDVATVSALAETAEEKADAREFQQAYMAFLDFFENKMLVYLSSPEVDEAMVRMLDGQIDGLRDAAMGPLDRILDSMIAEAGKADEQFDAVRRSTINLAMAIALLGVAVALIIATLITRSITRPVARVVEMIQEMEKGHLDTRLQLDSNDEIGLMAKTMDAFADSLQHEVVEALEKLAASDLTFTAVPRDTRDLVRGSLKKAGADLNDIMAQMNEAGDQVASAAGQVSDASQSLSQGSTESASSLEQISSSMNEMASQTKANAENASQANQLADGAKAAAGTGNAQMAEMIMAMSDIEDSSKNISKIIKVIDEIAFQTNLLALNAAVEAARAGQHGKGFAVVAEEVRNLAARSAKAARETAELIEGSVGKTKKGTEIANNTAEALGNIVREITKVSDLVAEIAASSSEQAKGISEVSQGLGQIDQVTQQNTANAEESAAAAEELSSQAAQLKAMLARFTLKGTAGSRRSVAAALPAPPRPKKIQPADSRGGWGNHPKQETSGSVKPSELIALDDSEFGKY